jgi:acetolactate synthase-1/2/3 large subunit
MGFGPPAALGAKIAAPDRVVTSMVGDGGFGQNPAMLATAREMDLGVIWVVMNNNAFGTIAGLQKAITPSPYRSGLQAGLGNMTG